MTTPFDAPPTARSAGANLGVLVRGGLGAMAGAAVGVLAFRWLAQQGFYGIMLPGALIGLGAGWAARGRSVSLGVFCAIAALLVAVVAEWAVFPFVKDKSFSFFLLHVHELPAAKLLMMALGVAFAYWFGQGR
jgi:hypothetical protein